MRTTLISLVVVVSPGWCMAQTCTNLEILPNGSSFYVTYYAWNAFNAFPANEFPVQGFWGGTGGAGSTSYLHTSGVSPFIGAAVCYWSWEGTQLNFSPAWGLSSQVVSHQVSGGCPLNAPLYIDNLEADAFIWSTQVVDCAAGTFRLVLTDNPNEIGDFTIGTRANGANYQLYKDGVLLESGGLSTKFVSNPASFVFNGLTLGRYEVRIVTPNSTPIFPYAYQNLMQSGGPVFFVPKPGECGTNLAARVRLQGAAPTSGDLMSDALRAAGLVPTTEPYSTLGYSYIGSTPGVSIPPAMLTATGNDAIVDWIVVELRSTSTPTQILYSAPALVQRDGDVMGLDGDPYLTVPLAAGNYRVGFKHRNHLGVMSLTDMPLAAITSWVDAGANALYNSGACTLNSLIGTCLWSGDASGDGTLKYTGSGNDRDPILTAVGSTTPNNSMNNVYDRRDTNLDGVIKYTGTANDRDIILTNVGSTTPNNTRAQQLP